MILPGIFGIRGLQHSQPVSDICTCIMAALIVGSVKELKQKNEEQKKEQNLS